MSVGRRATLALALVATGCTSLTPPDQRSVPPIPPSWPVGDAYLTQREGNLASLDYRQLFRDPRLQRLIARSLAGNRNLAQQVANLRAVAAAYRIQRAAQVPSVDMTIDGTFSERGGSGSGAPTTTTGTSGSQGFNQGYTAELGVPAYEIDLFGRLRNLSQAAFDRYLATAAAARAVRLTTVGALVTAWATLAADRDVAAIAADTVKSARMSVRLTRLRLGGGIAPRTDLASAETVLATAEADLAAATTAVAQDRNAITLLVGGVVADADLPRSLVEVMPGLGPVPAGLDSSILLRRPDVVEAEYQLRAANADIGAARAARFPRITLTGLLGFASTALASLFTGGGAFASAAPGVTAPIFHGGALKAGVDQAVAQRDAALAAYDYAIQSAFRDTANALARRGTIADQLGADRRLVAAAGDAYRLADARYRGGVDTFLNSLIAQRTLYAARRSLVATQLADAVSLSQLYVALGGDATLGHGPLQTSGDPAHPHR